MSKFYVPVVWEMYGYIEVDADTFEDALREAEDSKNSYPIPEDGEYLEDSFEIDSDGIIRDENWHVCNI